MRLTHADLLAAEKELHRRHLSEFVKDAWHILEPSTDLKWGWALDAICEHLEAVTSGQISRLLMNVPPGTMKSLLTSVFWPAWEWGPRKAAHLKVISTAHEQTLAIRDNRKMRMLVKSPWYQERYELGLATDQDAKLYFENSDMGFRQACAFASITGKRGDRVILDDPISSKHSNSDAHLKEAERAFKEDLPTRVTNDDAAIVVIMQRLHERDTTGIIEEMELAYEKLVIPMEFEPERKCVTSIGWEDPRTEDGELMFPERFGPAKVEELKKTLGDYAAAGQLQQRPTPRGGAIFKTDDLRYWEDLPPLRWRKIYADTAQKTKEKSDYTVLQCWGAGQDGKAYLIDQVRGKFEAPELLSVAKAFWAKQKADILPGRGHVRSLAVEDKSSGTGLIQQLQREGLIPVEPIQRTTDKYTRALDVAPSFASGLVMLPKDAEWLGTYRAELTSFTGDGAGHDDQVDPTMDAVKEICGQAHQSWVGLL